MQKKNRKKLIIYSGILAVAVAVLLVGVFFWYLPKMWLNKLENEYLLQHRNMFRVQRVQAGAFNKFILHDVQLGSTEKPLATATRAELLLHSDLRQKFDSIPVKKLILHDCEIKVNAVKRKIYINDILLEKFVKSLIQLPPAPNGSPLPLEINSYFSLGNKRTPALLKLEIQSNSGKLNIKCFWQNKDNPAINGSWQSFIDPSADQFSVLLSDHLTGVFMQEILLRSGMPARATAVLEKAVISGTGSFSGTFKDLQIHELSYSGKVEKPELAFYKYKFKNMGSFLLKLQKDSKGIHCQIPELSLNKGKTPFLKNINITSRKKITFSAECNFQQLAADYLAKQINQPVTTKGLFFEQINGIWDTDSGIWSFKQNNRPTAKQHLLLVAGNITFSIQPEKIEIHASGKASAGTVNQQIKFKNFEVYTSDNQKKLHSSQGIMSSKTVFGSRLRPDEHTLSLNCSDFTAVTPWGIAELNGLSVSADLRQLQDGIWNIFTSFSGLSGKLANQQFLLLPVGWRGFFRLEVDRKKAAYNLKTLDWKSDELKLDCNKVEYAMPNVHIKLDGTILNKVFSTGNATVQAEKITTENMTVKQPKLDLTYDASRNKADKLQGSASCSHGLFPLSENWFIKKIVEAKAGFSLPDWDSNPEKFTLQAHLLDWQTGVFSGIIQNSKWQCNREKDQSWYCVADFDFMRMQSKDQQFGKGQFGKSSLAINVFSDAKGAVSRFNLQGIMAQTSWIKGDYHIGSENVQCVVKYNESGNTLLQGSVNMNNANILGRNLTASTPELKSDFTALDLKNINGSISFSPGSISNAQGDLELRKAQFTLPLYIGNKPPIDPRSGKFTVGDVYYKQQREGSFSGTIQHFMQLPAGVTDTLSHQITLSGKLASDKFGGKAVSVNCNWLLPPEKDLIRWQFSMPESKLVQILDVSNYLNLPVNCTALKGNFTLDGSLEVSAGKPPESVIKLNSINTSWQLGDVVAEGVTAAGVLSFSDNMFSLMPQDVSAAKILWNNILLQDNELNMSINRDGKLQIANWQGCYLGGKFRSVQIPSIQLNKSTAIPTAKFAISDMPLTGFFNTFGIKYLISDALLNGNIQLNTANNKLFAESASLAFKSPAGKNLQLKLKNPSAIRMRDMQFRDFTLAILNAMKCYQANFDFSTTPEEIVMNMKADGVPSSPVPFVYQGRGAATPFRPAEPGENGFAGEIELNVNLKLHPDNAGD
ncbi:MAG: hypothetical protein IKD10_05565 [Lentisphaeria bacterium]|nr:hypothetical protein [Lentisphaeria bacterium]